MDQTGHFYRLTKVDALGRHTLTTGWKDAVEHAKQLIWRYDPNAHIEIEPYDGTNATEGSM